MENLTAPRLDADLTVTVNNRCFTLRSAKQRIVFDFPDFGTLQSVRQVTRERLHFGIHRLAALLHEFKLTAEIRVSGWRMLSLGQGCSNAILRFLGLPHVQLGQIAAKSAEKTRQQDACPVDEQR